MKKWKLITLISSLTILVAVAVFLLIVFTRNPKINNYKYPSVYPMVSDKNETFVKLGSRNITKEEIYNAGIITYGLSVMNDLIDCQLIDINSVSEEEYQNHYKKVYATYNSISIDEVTFSEEQDKTFKEQMFIQGYYTDEAIKKAITLDCARNKFGRLKLQEQVSAYVPTTEKPSYYTTGEIRTAIDQIDELNPKAEVLYLSFRSELEALNLLKDYGIDIQNLKNGWKKTDGTYLTKAEILDTFIKMYNQINGTELTEETITVYKKSELASISSTIASMVFNTLTDLSKSNDTSSALKNSYVADPKNKEYMSGYVYLVVKVKTSEVITPEQFIEISQKGTTDEVLKEAYDKVSKKLFETKLTSSFISNNLYLERTKANLEIFDERLDNSYLLTYEQVRKSLNADTFYQLTTKENSEYVVTFNVNQNQKGITADDLYNEIVERYGALIAVQFMNYYLLFNQEYSTVYDFEKKQKLSDFDMSYALNVEQLKSALEDGTMAKYGYNQKYGWNNFLRDYSGMTNLDDTIVLGDAYNKALEKVLKTTYSVTNDVTDEIYQEFINAYIKQTKSVDEFNTYLNSLDSDTYQNTVVYQTIKYFIDFFQVKASIVEFYFDKNGDGTADEGVLENVEKAKTLLSALMLIAKDNISTLKPLDNPTEEYALAKKILDTINAGKYGTLRLSGNTIESRIKDLIKIYNASSIEDLVFGNYKKMGLRFSYTTSKTYTDTTIDGKFRTTFKDIWNQIYNGSLLLDDGTFAKFNCGQTINESNNNLQAEGISSTKPYVINKFIENNNRYSMAVLSEVINITWYSNYETEAKKDVRLMPDAERIQKLLVYYEMSLIDASERTYEQSKLYNENSPIDYEKAYVNNLLGTIYKYFNTEERYELFINNLRKIKLNNGEISFTNPMYADICKQMIDVIYEK